MFYANCISVTLEKNNYKQPSVTDPTFPTQLATEKATFFFNFFPKYYSSP